MAWNNLPFTHKIVSLSQGPVTTNGAITSDVISLKNAIRATVIVDLTQAVGHASVVSVRQATAVDGVTNAAGPVCQAWLNEDVASSDTLVKQTDAAAITVTNNIKKKQIVFEIDPAALTDGYDCVYVTVGDSSQATNFANITALVRTNFQQATPPAVITD